MDPTGMLVAISNILVVVASGGLIFISLRDAHAHSSKDLQKVMDTEDDQQERLIRLVDKVLDEREEHDARMHQPVPQEAPKEEESSEEG